MKEHSVLLGENSLYRSFVNVGEVVPEKVVVRPGAERFHRRDLEADDPEPACTARVGGIEWAVVDGDDAVEFGRSPCHDCFRPVLEHFATLSNSDVHLRNGEPFDLKGELGVDFEDLPREGSVESPRGVQLASLTEEVLVTKQKKMHAPTPSGPLCESVGRYRRKPREVLRGHYDLCRGCFSRDVVDEWEGDG